ncbi:MULTISPECIES: DoxX family protein [unclassified Sinorhizobium]|uniref:DoxX family protein n=1 Tax=unclassified Sinorhizobium TaxID=2613772 RepID=UPI003524B8BA
MSAYERIEQYRPFALALLRIVTALLFIEHGTQKLFNFPEANFGDQMPTIFIVAGVIELIGGILVLLGLFTRPVAFILSGEMAFAYFLEHLPVSFFPAINEGDGAVLFCFIFLYLVFAGAGAWSLDGRRV